MTSILHNREGLQLLDFIHGSCSWVMKCKGTKDGSSADKPSDATVQVHNIAQSKLIKPNKLKLHQKAQALCVIV